PKFVCTGAARGQHWFIIGGILKMLEPSANQTGDYMSSQPRILINKPVFYTSGAFILGLVLFAALAPALLQSVFSAVQSWIFGHASWFYMLAVAVILRSTLYAALSRYGEIKLGPDHSEPDFRDITWYSMLFAAGMGIGLMFFGVAEPVMHFLDPPVGEGGTVQIGRASCRERGEMWGGWV